MPGAAAFSIGRAAPSSGCRSGGLLNVIRVQAQRPIESAAERKGASVGPEGRTERYNYFTRYTVFWIGGKRPSYSIVISGFRKLENAGTRTLMVQAIS